MYGGKENTLKINKELLQNPRFTQRASIQRLAPRVPTKLHQSYEKPLIPPKPPKPPIPHKPQKLSVFLPTFVPAVQQLTENEQISDDDDWEDSDEWSESEEPKENKKFTSSPESIICSNIAELLSTEEKYINSLERGLSLYLRQVQHDEELSERYRDKFQMVHIAIENILSVHKDYVYPGFKECNKDMIENLLQIAKVFLQCIDCLSNRNKFYEHIEYAMDKAKLTSIVDEKIEYFNEHAKTNNDSLGIMSCLMEPIQRIPRYKLIMESIVKQLYKLYDSTVCNKSDVHGAMERCALAVYWIGQVLENANEVVFLNDINFGEEVVCLKNLGIFLKGGELQIQSSTKPNPFNGKIFAFEKTIIITKFCKKNSAWLYICQGKHEWQNLKLAIENHQPDQSPKSIHITHHDDDNVKFTFKKSDGSSIQEWFKLLNSLITSDNIKKISSISSGHSKITKVTQGLINAESIVLTERQHIKVLLKNRRAYLFSFNQALVNLAAFIDELNILIHFHKEILFEDLQNCDNDERKIIQVLQKHMSDEAINNYKRYSIEAGKAIHRLRSHKIQLKQHKSATKPFNGFAILPIQRLQVYVKTLEMCGKKEYESSDCNIQLLSAAAMLNRSFLHLYNTLLDYLQLCTIENLSYGEVIYSDNITVICCMKRKSTEIECAKGIIMESGLVCAEYKTDIIGNTEITKIIAHTANPSLTICSKSTKKSTTSIIFQKKCSFPEIKFSNLNKKQIFADKLHKQGVYWS